MNRKGLLIIGFILLTIFAFGIIIFYSTSRKDFLAETVGHEKNYFQQYFGGTLDQIKRGQIVFSFGCTAKKLVQQSTVKLPYTLDLDSNIITVAQFVNIPAKFEFKDEKLGFILDLATWGNFKFKGDTQEFIELSLMATPGAVKMQEGVQAIKEVIQKLETAGWKRASGFESSLVPLDDKSIEKRITWDQKRERSKGGSGPKLMAWKSKDYRVDLHALVLPEKMMDSKSELKVSVELCIKKI